MVDPFTRGKFGVSTKAMATDGSGGKSHDPTEMSGLDASTAPSGRDDVFFSTVGTTNASKSRRDLPTAWLAIGG